LPVKHLHRRLARLEQRVNPPEDPEDRRLVALLRERRRRRLEASGETDEDLPWKTLCSPPGKRLSIAETLRLGRQLLGAF
jgi:hypothetical protein